MAKTQAEEIFGEVSDFRGAFGAGKKKQDSTPVCSKERTPHWHDSCFKGTEMKEEHVVTEEELSSHF